MRPLASNAAVFGPGLTWCVRARAWELMALSQVPAEATALIVGDDGAIVRRQCYRGEAGPQALAEAEQIAEEPGAEQNRATFSCNWGRRAESAWQGLGLT